MAHMVRSLPWYREVTGSNPVEVRNLFFRLITQLQCDVPQVFTLGLLLILILQLKNPIALKELISEHLLRTLLYLTLPIVYTTLKEL